MSETEEDEKMVQEALKEDEEEFQPGDYLSTSPECKYHLFWADRPLILSSLR